MRILVFCDDRYHPAKTVRRGLAPIEASTAFRFDWVQDAAGWNPSYLDNYPAVLFSKSNHVSAANWEPWVDQEVAAAFLRYVETGGGLAAIHSGTASYSELGPLRQAVGGTFLEHPPLGPVQLEPRAGHPLCAQVTSPFTVVDEHYVMALDDPGADVFLHSRSERGVEPAGWTRTVGLGRSAVLTPGHTEEVWLHPSFQQLLSNVLSWVTSSNAARIGSP